MRDVADGVLTTPEIRDKVLQVRESARVSENPGIPEAATRLVAAATADDGEAFVAAVTQMHGACETAGL